MGKLLLFRHAQASYGSKNYDQLSDLGYEQSRTLGRYLVENEVVMDKIYLGELLRHRQTFEMVEEAYAKAGKSLPEPIVLPELNEHRGPEILRMLAPTLVETDPLVKEWQAAKGDDPKSIRRYSLKIFHHGMDLWAKGALAHLQPDKYDDWLTFRAKVLRGLGVIQHQNGDQRGITIGAFTSGGTISAAMGHVLGMSNESKVMELNGLVQNTSITEFVFTQKRMTLKSFNGVPHLAEEMVTFV